ncbi:MAG: tetratricopeptide repeat protein, partial [Anaerolineales bacterium]
TAIPTPTPIPAVTLEAAEKALFFGDWDLALSEFQAAFSASDDAEIRGAAQFGIGVTRMRAGDYVEGLEAISAYLRDFPEHTSRGHAFFLRALAHEQLDQDALAIPDYDSYLALRPGILDSFVHERVGDALRGLGVPTEAVVRYQAALEAPRLGSTLGLQLKIGRAYLEASDFQAALIQFDAVLEQASDFSTKATANLLAGRVLEALGDLEGAHARYLDSVYHYPTGYDAYVGLITLVEAGVLVDEFQRGYVDYEAGAFQPAYDAFSRYIAASPTAAAFYYRGLSSRGLGDAAAAVEDFATLIDTYPDDAIAGEAWVAKAYTEWAYLGRYDTAVSTYLDFVAALPGNPSAPAALFSAGRTAERVGNLERAAEIWLRLPAEYPESSQAFYGAFEPGILYFRMGDYERARAAFLLSDQHAADSSQHAKALLWVGKTYWMDGDLAETEQAWIAAAAADPTGYYSARAADLLAGREAFDPGGLIDFTTDPEQERLEAEAWLRATFSISGPEPLSALDGVLANDPRILRGIEFLTLGLSTEARREFSSLQREVQNDAEATYRLMHKFLELRQYRLAILTSRQVMRLADMDDAATMGAPVYFNHIRFAPYYGDLILPEAARNGFNGLFLLSVVRQESLFESASTSYAQAQGLMQVIPSTGQSIANQLGWPPDYENADLYRPMVSVRFGTYYMAQQRDRFDGDLFTALAAYNAGPGNARIWEELAPDDPDLFLEVIRLNQPHNYIRVIYEVFSIYRDLYVTP